MKKTITIAGGGLAGLSLGIALRLRNVPVILHEASTYPRHRVCGEFLSGVSAETLETLGIAECLEGASRLESAVWSDSQGVLGEMTAPGLGLSRRVLDDRLQARFCELGGMLYTQSRITLAEGVVWAAGRPRKPSRWLGLKCHARNLPLTQDLEMFTSRNGYIGLAKIEEDKVNICGLFKKMQPMNSKGTDLLLHILRESRLDALADRLESADLDESSFCGVAGFQTGLQSGPAFCIGDAASMIPPFTGNGMSMAFESAECALLPALDFAKGRKSWMEAAMEATAQQLTRFKRRLAVAGLAHHFLMSPTTWKTARALSHFHCLPIQSLLPLVR